MTDTTEWQDPFAEDETARERERRRAEREARRRETQAAVGEKAAAEQAVAAPPPPSDPAPTPAVPASPPRPAATAPGRDHLLLRRTIGGLIFAVVAVVIIFGITKVIDQIDGADDSKPALVIPKQTSAITIPEGYDRRQIAALAKKEGLKGDYMKATQAPPKHSSFNLADYDAQGAPSLEGFLFPDTWNDLPKHATVHDLVDRQLADFQQRIKGVDMSYARSKNLTVYDVVNIASIIQREIAQPEEMKLAAAVIYNRLAANNPLGMDSTIRYYLQNYDEQLTESELGEDEPYNTRIYTGLPPTPISNPGLAAIEAAAKPAKSDVFYFVIKPGTCNEHVFVKTQEEFDQASAEYQQALEEQGGSPTNC